MEQDTKHSPRGGRTPYHPDDWPVFAPVPVGGFEITPLFDSEWQLVPREFVPEADPAEWLELTGQQSDQMVRSRVLCFLLRSDRHTILVDCGVGKWDWWRYGRSSRLVDSLSQAGVQPADIEVVVLTHLHPDHGGGAMTPSPGGPVPTFPNARYVLSRPEWEAYVDPGWVVTSASRLAQKSVQVAFQPLAGSGLLDLIELDHQLKPEVRLVSAPGHTPGALMVQVHSGGKAAFLIGDTAHHPAQLKRPEWCARNDYDPAAAASSRATLVREATRLGALIGAAHLEELSPPLRTLDP